MNKDVAREALTVASSVLNDLNVRWWIDCGTLLGAIRDGDFMDHDQDIDLASWDWERSEEISRAFLAAGFTPRMTFGVPERGHEQSFKFRDLKVDLFYFYPAGETCWQGSWLYDHLIVSEFSTAIVARTKAMRFCGIDVRVPIDPEAMLAARYGNWRSTVEKWDWTRDPRCITAETRPA